MRRFYCWIAVPILSSVFFACQSAVLSTGLTVESETKDAVRDELPEVVAQVNGTPIARIELERAAVREQELQAEQPIPPQFRDAVYRRILDQLVAFYLLIQESVAREVAVTPVEIKNEIKRIRTTFATDNDFEAQLSTWQTSIDVLPNEARKDLVVAKVIELEINPKLSLTEPLVRGFYEQHQDQFTEPMAIRASHTLISIPENVDDSTYKAARERAERVLAEVCRGASFAELTRTHSDDEAMVTTGGDISLVVQGQMVPPFEEALFPLQPDSLSGVVPSSFGCHIIRAPEQQSKRLVPFAEASSTIRLLLLDRERQILTASFIDELKAASTIEVYL